MSILMFILWFYPDFHICVYSLSKKVLKHLKNQLKGIVEIPFVLTLARLFTDLELALRFVLPSSHIFLWVISVSSSSSTSQYVICMLILLTFQIYLITVAGVTDYVQNTTDHLNKLWSNVTVNAAEIAQVEQQVSYVKKIKNKFNSLCLWIYLCLQYECCGKLGSKDYILLERRIPKNCYRNFSGQESDLFKESCLTVLQGMARKCGSTGLAIKLTLFGFEVRIFIFYRK